MLDLQKITATRKLYEIKMPNGDELTLKMPTQAMYEDILSLQDKGKLENPIEIMGAVFKITTDILNLNTQGKKYSVSEISCALDLATAVLVIQDYLENTTKILGE